MEEQIQPAVTAIKLDVPVTRLWNAVKQCETIDDVNVLLDSDNAHQAQASNQFPFLRIAIERAADLFAENKQPFIQAVEGELAIFFPDTAPNIPTDLEALIFLLYVTKHGTTPRPGDMTLIDQYFDLTLDTVTAALGEDDSLYLTRLRRICGPDAQIQVTGYATCEDFHHEKWRLLSRVLNLVVEEITGSELLDIVLDALESDEEASIVSAIDTVRGNFPELEVETPPAIKELVQRLNEAPGNLENLLDLIGQLETQSEAGEIAKAYLAEWVQRTPRFEQDVMTFGNDAASALGVELEEIGDIVEGCTSYLFTAHVLAQLQNIYPDLELPGIVHWTENDANLWAWLLEGGTIDGGMVMSSDYAAPITYILVQMGGKNPLGSLNGRLKGAHNKDGAPTLISQLKNATTPRAKGGQKTGGKKKGGSKKPPLLHTNICHALVMRKYRFQALNHMMWREVHFMDPVIGDTLCELRPAFLIECDDIVQGALVTNENWQNLVRLYNANHSDCPFDETAINHPRLLLGDAPDPVDYLTLCYALEDALKTNISNDAPHYLTLCKALTRSTLLVRDSLGIESGEASTGNMAGKETKRRREEMASCCTVFSQRTMRLLADTLAIQAPGLGQTAQVLENCNVAVTDKGTTMSLLPIYQSQMLSFVQSMDRGHPLIVRLKRIHITGAGEQQTFGNQTYREATYEVADSIVMVYRPNHGTGLFEYVANPDDDLLHVPGLTISAYSMLDLTGTTDPTQDPGYGSFVNTGYYNQDIIAFTQFIQGQDMINLLNACSANHPVFVHNARSYDAEADDYVNIVDQFSYICALYGHEKGELEGPCTINLGGGCTIYVNDAFDDFAAFYKLGEALQLDRRQYKENSFQVGSKNNRQTMVVRRLGSMPFYSTHIYCSTLATELSRAQDFHVQGPIDRFETKEAMTIRCVQYFLDELAIAQSMQS